MRKSEWFAVGIAALAFATGAAFYPSMPANVASHWNAAGQVNGTMPRAWGVFLFPAIIAVVLFILLLVPRIDPKKENIAKFRNYYDSFIAALGVFFYYIYLLTLLWNVGYRFNFTAFITPAIAALFYAVGILLPHTALNYMIGIRTPWTISSESVWRATHRVGGAAFKICGVIALLGIAFPGAAIWLLVAPVVAAAVGLVIYSYVLYRREK